MILRLMFALLCSAFLILLLARIVTEIYAIPRLITIQNAPIRRVAVVFGAGLGRDGRPSPVLRDRVRTAATLYQQGKVEKLLMSGDNRFVYYNEPGAMKAYALELGVPEEAIVLDYAGRRTYDTCYRARDIFQVQQIILVTQRFHLPRAIYLCNHLGVNAVGVPSDIRQYSAGSIFFWNLRELPATLTALWEIHVSHPIPVLGDPEPVFPLEAQ